MSARETSIGQVWSQTSACLLLCMYIGSYIGLRSPLVIIGRVTIGRVIISRVIIGRVIIGRVIVSRVIIGRVIVGRVIVSRLR